MSRSLFTALALLGLTLPVLANNETRTSPGIGALDSKFSPAGGIIIDMVGVNGKRLTAQVPPSKLKNGWVSASTSFYTIWTQTGFDAYTLETLLGGGLSKVNIRVTLQDGDSGSGNPVYVAMFGMANFPYRSAMQPGNYDFDGGTDLYLAIKLADGTYVNAGYMGLTTTYRLDAGGDTLETFTGFPGVYALTDSQYNNVTHPPQYMPPFAVTGWFSVSPASLPALYQTLVSQGSMSVGIWDVDPGDQYYDFTQGTGSDIMDIPLIPAHVVSFTATPAAVFGSGSVTLSWQTQAATSVAIDNGVAVDPAAVNGSVTINVATPATYTLTATGTGGSDTATVTVRVLPPLTVATTTLPNGIAGSSYSQLLAATGGTAPYAWSTASGSLPAGLSLRTDGTISGIPTSAGTASFLAQVIDSSNPAQTATEPLTLTITPGLSVTTLVLPNAVLGASYRQPVTASGGTAPYLWSIATGVLPPGLTLNDAGVISGTPTAATTSTFTLRVTDSTTPIAQTRLQSYTLTVGSTLSIQTTTLPTATVGNTYTQALNALGGTLPYIWSLDSGPLPDGLTLSSAGVVSGTPPAPGLATFIVRVTDSTAPTAQTATQTLKIYVVQQLTIDTVTLPDGTASRSYAAALSVRNGVQPYVWTLTSGALPPGLNLLASGAIIGTPSTAGDYTFSLTASDSSVPTALSVAQRYTVRITPAFTITTTSLPAGTAGLPYASSVKASDGSLPYTFAIIFGTLPPGLNLMPDGTITGTPTAPGAYNLLIRATDSTLPAPQTSDRALVIDVNSNLAIVTASLPDATTGILYSQMLTAINGAPSYTWTVAAGALPPGLSLLQSGVLIGTPASDGTFKFTIQATDSAHPVPATTTRAYTVDVASPLVIKTDSISSGIIDAPYATVLTTVGGIQPYTYSLTSGTLPPGLALSSIGVISGSPTTAGKYTFTITVADSGVTTTSATRTYTVSVSEPLRIPETKLSTATVGSLYTWQMEVLGGIAPYTWTVSAEDLPPGITLLAPGVLIGSPTRQGTYTFTVHVTDGTNPAAQTATREVTLKVVAPLSISEQTFETITPGIPFSASLTASGGIQPHAWTLVSGSLPAGLTLDSTGRITGASSATGAYPITVRVSDSAQPPQIVSREFILLVAEPFAVVTTSPMTSAVVGLAYSQQLAFSAGKVPFSCSVSSGALPDGLSLAKDGTISGRATTVGAAQFIVTCLDSAGQTATRPLTLPVEEALSIVSTTIPPVVAGAVYFRTFQHLGGNGPFAWTVSSGALPPGLTFTTDGLLTGVATVTGKYPVTVTVSDNSQPTPQIASLAITLNVTALLTAIPQKFVAIAGTTFNRSVTATGGAEPLSWTVASGALPPGLNLSTNGSVTGIPTLAGTYTAVLNVVDDIGQVASMQVTFAINDPLAIPLSNLPSGTVGVSYATALHATGGGSNPVWTLASGSLPPGLQLLASGAIVGVPASDGTFTMNVTVNNGTQTASKSFTIVIAPAPTGLQIPPTSAALPNATVGILYRAPLTVTGARTPVFWSASAGSVLPPGLAIDTSGALVGTPSAAGTYSFGLSAVDADRRTVSAAYVLSVAANVAITTTDLGKATMGTSYATALAATGGTGPYIWTVEGLPPGLVFSRTGVISGTPTKPGQFIVTLTVADSSAIPLTSTKIVPLSVSSALSIMGTVCTAGTVGTPYTFTFSASNGVAPYAWNLVSGLLAPGLSLSRDGILSGTPTKAGAWFFVVQVTDSTGQRATQQEYIAVQDSLSIATPSIDPLRFSVPVSLQLSATGGTSPYSWRIASGSLPTGLALTTNGILAGTPVSAGAYRVTVEVSDAQQRKATVLYTVTVNSASLPPIRIAPDGVTLDPATQTAVTVSVAQPFEVDLTGTLTVAGTDDQDLTFLQSGTARRSVQFRIQAGALRAEFPQGAPILQSGTTAGLITLTATVDNLLSTQSSTAQNRVLPLPPAITASLYEKAADGFALVIDGYSTPRDMQSATFRFFSGTTSSVPFTLDVTSIFSAWYKTAASRGSGVFSYRQNFSLTGDLARMSIAYVEVTLTNSVGTSVTQQIPVAN